MTNKERQLAVFYSTEARKGNGSVGKSGLPIYYQSVREDLFDKPGSSKGKGLWQINNPPRKDYKEVEYKPYDQSTRDSKDLTNSDRIRSRRHSGEKSFDKMFMRNFRKQGYEDKSSRKQSLISIK